MRPDGSQPEQVPFDERPNWTPHPSPDGKSILILSYDEDVTGHAVNTDVTLRILNVSSGAEAKPKSCTSLNWRYIGS